MSKKSKIAEEKAKRVNASLVNSIAPTAINFRKDGFDFSTVSACGMTVTRYPAKAQYEWLNEVSNQNNTISSILYTPEKDPSDILRAIGNSVAQNQGVADGTVLADPVEQTRARKIVEDGSQIIEQIANNNESIGYISINTLVIGADEKDIDNKKRAVKNKFVGRQFNLSQLNFLQKEVFQAVSPCDVTPDVILGASNQLMPMSTMFGGFPFAFAGYNDGEGTYFGKDGTGAPIIVDTWRRGEDRTNSNLVCMGLSGGGKSTALKHLMLNEWETGTKIVVIDPHGEYKEICENLEGDWIDVVGGTGSRINPFHIYLTNNDIRNGDSGLSPLAKHINNLEVFFRLYLDLTTLQVAVLKECIELVYKEKGITYDSEVSRIPAENFPIMSDLYSFLDVKYKEVEKTLKQGEENIYKTLHTLLRNIAIGSDSHIWNGPSTVNVRKDFIVFDTSAVNGTSSNIRTTLYHTVLNYCENYLYRNPHERVILVCDEAHNVIDRRLPETVARLANLEKSVRKFESALWICSQQLNDFLDPSIRKEGEAILDQPNIKLLMPVGRGRDLHALKDLYTLTDAEEERLMQQQRGKGLIIIGSRRLTIDFEIPPHHFSLMGTGGGR